MPHDRFNIDIYVINAPSSPISYLLHHHSILNKFENVPVSCLSVSFDPFTYLKCSSMAIFQQLSVNFEVLGSQVKEAPDGIFTVCTDLWERFYIHVDNSLHVREKEDIILRCA